MPPSPEDGGMKLVRLIRDTFKTRVWVAAGVALVAFAVASATGAFAAQVLALAASIALMCAIVTGRPLT
jgi:hypothetical protein